MTLKEIQIRFDYTALIRREQLYLLRLMGWYDGNRHELPDRPHLMSEERAKELEHIAAEIAGVRIDINGQAVCIDF